MEYAHKLMQRRASWPGYPAAPPWPWPTAPAKERDKMIVVILPDSGERYLSSPCSRAVHRCETVQATIS